MKSPIAPGATETFSITWLASSTCTGSVHYPSGGNFTLSKHSLSAGTSYKTTAWSWLIPSSAGLGTATISFSCTYVGATKGGTTTFTIATPIVWSISFAGVGYVAEPPPSVQVLIQVQPSTIAATCTWSLVLPGGGHQSGSVKCGQALFVTLPSGTPAGAIQWVLTATFEGVTKKATGTTDIPAIP